MSPTIRTFAATVAVLLATAATLPAQTITRFGNDDDGRAWARANDFAKRFGANVRAGDGAGIATWEYAIVNPDDVPLVQGQIAWNDDNEFHAYTFGMDDVGNTDFALDFLDEILEANVNPTGLNTLIARVRSEPDGVVVLSPFTIVFQAGGTVTFDQFLTGDENAEWVVIQDPRFAGGFRIDYPPFDGEVFPSSVQFRPGVTQNSQTLYQFKIGATNVVPEPSTYALMATGLAGLGAVARRRRRTAE